MRDRPTTLQLDSELKARNLSAMCALLAEYSIAPVVDTQPTVEFASHTDLTVCVLDYTFVTGDAQDALRVIEHYEMGGLAPRNQWGSRYYGSDRTLPSGVTVRVRCTEECTRQIGMTLAGITP